MKNQDFMQKVHIFLQFFFLGGAHPPRHHLNLGEGGIICDKSRFNAKKSKKKSNFRGGGTHPPHPRLNLPQDEVQKVLQFQQYFMSLGILTLYKKGGNDSFQIGCHCFKIRVVRKPS